MAPEGAYDEEMSGFNNTKELLRAQTLLFLHIHSSFTQSSIRCAIDLGIPDAIHNLGGGPVTLQELSAALPGLHPSKIIFLARLMRLLTHLGIFATQTIDDDGGDKEGYVLTPVSKLLVKKSPVNMVTFVRFQTNPHQMVPMSDWLRSPAPTLFEETFGQPCWKHMEENPELGHAFNEAMACESTTVKKAITKDCRDVFDGVTSLVDVGGGTGTTATALAEAFPELKCMVLDLPHVVAKAVPECSSRVTMIAGDMFEHIPPADAVLLKMILHNWSDDDCVKILKRCKEAIPADGGKVILVEMVVGSDASDKELLEAQLFSDMIMISIFGSTERDEEQLSKVFYKAGFSSYKIKHAIGLKSVIEVYP